MYIWHLNNAVICYYDTYINMYAYTVYYYITSTIVESAFEPYEYIILVLKRNRNILKSTK